MLSHTVSFKYCLGKPLWRVSSVSFDCSRYFVNTWVFAFSFLCNCVFVYSGGVGHSHPALPGPVCDAHQGSHPPGGLERGPLLPQAWLDQTTQLKGVSVSLRTCLLNYCLRPAVAGNESNENNWPQQSFKPFCVMGRCGWMQLHRFSSPWVLGLGF